MNELARVTEKTRLTAADLHINPRYAHKYRPLTDEEYTSLKDSVRTLRKFVTALDILPDGTIICGHHRHRIWMELRQEGVGIKLPFKVHQFKDQGAIDRFQEANEEHRRHGAPLLAKAQMALEDLPTVQAEITRQAKARSGKTRAARQKKGEDLTGPSLRIVAEKYGVSPASLQQLREIRKHGTPEEIAAVELGTVSISVMSKRIRDRRKTEGKISQERDHGPEYHVVMRIKDLFLRIVDDKYRRYADAHGWSVEEELESHDRLFVDALDLLIGQYEQAGQSRQANAP